MDDETKAARRMWQQVIEDYGDGKVLPVLVVGVRLLAKGKLDFDTSWWGPAKDVAELKREELMVAVQEIVVTIMDGLAEIQGTPSGLVGGLRQGQESDIVAQ